MNETIRESVFKKYKSKCGNCSKKGEEVHHIVPTAVGGTDNINNLVLLCQGCHGKIHGVDFVNIRKLARKAKETARKKPGFQEGRPKAHGDKIEQALSMLSINGGDMSYTQVERLTGISKSTLIRRMREKKSSS